MKNRRTAFSIFVARTAIACFGYGAFALVMLHVLRPENANHMISDYAIGPYGWIMTSCFLAMSVGCLTLLVGLFRNGPKSATGRISAVLLGLASVGLVISAIFPTDVKRPVTSAGYIHFISFLVNIGSIVFAAILLSVAVRSDPLWRGYQRTAIGLTSLIVLAFVLQFLTIIWRWQYALANRFFIIAVFAWMFATSVQLHTVTRESVPDS